ncbi:hypothetical protein ACW9N8_004503 [Vibrio parahaemolyticus]
MSVAFAVSGFLCIYCVSVPIYFWFCSKLMDKAWETAFLTFTLGGVFSYILSGYSGIMLNEIFKVSSSHFSFTKPIAMYLILTPYISFLSFILIIYVVISETRKNKKGDESVHSSGTRTFYGLNKILACYIILVVSMASGSRANTVIELVSSKFDFDSKTFCKLDKNYDGYMVLNPSYSKVLTYQKGADEPYVIYDCDL